MEKAASSCTPASSRKAKFKPKVSPRKLLKPAGFKSEVSQGEDEIEWQKLVKVGSGRRAAVKQKNLAPLQVSFGYGSQSTPEKSLENYGGSSAVKRIDAEIEPETFETPANTSSASDAHRANKKEFIEPWDCHNYYPVSLPLKRPSSGNLEPHGQESDASGYLDDEESSVNSALELGLMDHMEEEQMLLFQFPPSLPATRRLASSKGKDIATHGRKLGRIQAEKGSTLEDLPAGYMGKLLIYKSGSVKMKLGDTLLDVSSSSGCTSAQDISVINHTKKHCCVLGNGPKRAVVSLDVDCLLGGITNQR